MGVSLSPIPRIIVCNAATELLSPWISQGESAAIYLLNLFKCTHYLSASRQQYKNIFSKRMRIQLGRDALVALASRPAGLSPPGRGRAVSHPAQGSSRGSQTGLSSRPRRAGTWQAAKEEDLENTVN